MIEAIMYLGIGFLSAAFSVLLVVPLVHGRAVRLTTRRLERAPPASIMEVLASKDLLRAEFAMATRRLEMNIEELKTKSAGQLADLGRKADENNRLQSKLHVLSDQLRTTEEGSSVAATALRNAERALADKALEVSNLVGALDERSGLTESQKAEIAGLKSKLGALSDQLHATEEASTAKATALQDAERALSDKALEVANLVGELDRRSGPTESQQAENVVLETRLGVLSDQLRAAEQVSSAKDTALHAAERALSEKALEVANLGGALDERSTLAGSQQAEILALKMQVQTYEEQLASSGEELKAIRDLRDVGLVQLKAATQKRLEERAKFENFHRRVAELVQQLAAQPPDTLQQRTQDLENRLVEQSRLFNEREIELTQLRAKIDSAHKADADLRIAMAEMDSRAKAATQCLVTEKAQLQAALDRTNSRSRAALDHANGERTRLARENAMLRDRINSAAPEQARRVANG